jgi:hypothetical protein
LEHDEPSSLVPSRFFALSCSRLNPNMFLVLLWLSQSVLIWSKVQRTSGSKSRDQCECLLRCCISLPASLLVENHPPVLGRSWLNQIIVTSFERCWIFASECVLSEFFS